METFTTAEAADAVGISVRQFHGYAATLGVDAARKLPGPRGVKFWRSADVRRIKKHARSVAETKASAKS